MTAYKIHTDLKAIVNDTVISCNIMIKGQTNENVSFLIFLTSFLQRVSRYKRFVPRYKSQLYLGTSYMLYLFIV